VNSEDHPRRRGWAAGMASALVPLSALALFRLAHAAPPDATHAAIQVEAWLASPRTSPGDPVEIGPATLVPGARSWCDDERLFPGNSDDPGSPRT